jgi:hypothetical protein
LSDWKKITVVMSPRALVAPGVIHYFTLVYKAKTPRLVFLAHFFITWKVVMISSMTLIDHLLCWMVLDVTTFFCTYDI